MPASRGDASLHRPPVRATDMCWMCRADWKMAWAHLGWPVLLIDHSILSAHNASRRDLQGAGRVLALTAPCCKHTTPTIPRASLLESRELATHRHDVVGGRPNNAGHRVPQRRLDGGSCGSEESSHWRRRWRRGRGGARGRGGEGSILRVMVGDAEWVGRRMG